jgi:hypothetical protein
MHRVIERVKLGVKIISLVVGELHGGRGASVREPLSGRRGGGVEGRRGRGRRGRGRRGGRGRRRRKKE